MNHYQFNPVKNKVKAIAMYINMDCNLNCKMCEINKHVLEKPTIFQAKQAENLIKQYKQYNPNGVIGLESGELFANRKQFDNFVEVCKKYELKLGFVTNGTLVQKKDMENLKDILDYLVISVESHREEINDHIRGHGVFKKICRLTDWLEELGVGYCINTTLSKLNIDHVNEIYNFFTLRKYFYCQHLLVLAPSFYATQFSEKSSQNFYLQNGFINEKDKIVLIDRLSSYVEHTQGAKTSFTMEALELTKAIMSQDDKNLLDYPVCNTFERNLYVDYNGDIRLCSQNCFPAIANTNDKSLDLQELWEGNKTQAIRAKMALCREKCGLAPCNNKEVLSNRLDA